MITINDQKLNLIDLNEYITCNSKEFLNLLPQKTKPFLDLIVTSPPYWDMKKYGEVHQTGFNQSYEDYLDDIEQTFKNVYKLSKDNATLFLNSDTLKRGGKLVRLPDDIASRLEKVGWIHQDVIIWNKGKTLPWSRKGQMRNTFEYIYMFTKSNNYKYYIERIKTVDELKEWWIDYPERYSAQGKVPDNIWNYFIPTQGSWGTKKDFGDTEFKHACPFPPEMMARIIQLSSDEGDVVFDPYAGTGILLATAEKLNRKYLGLDTNPEYKQIFELVTKPLIEDKIKDINSYYTNQERLRLLLEDAIYKLRMLKFPKALLKTFYKFPDSTNIVSIKAVIALEEKLESYEENLKHKIGKASYYLVTDHEVEESTKKFLLDTINKAPFSKYGLITNVYFITTEQAINVIKLLDKNIHVYSRGIINNTSLQLDTIETVKSLQEESFTKLHSDKGIPPILSNIELHLEDYADIPAEKYKK